MKQAIKIMAASFLAVLLTSVAAHADDLGDEVTTLCEKMKQCTLDSMAEAEMAPEMKMMITQQLDMACVGLQARFGAAAQAHSLYQPALACVKSMQAMSCQEIEESDDSITPECDRYQELAEGY